MRAAASPEFFLAQAKDELFDHLLYRRLSRAERDGQNRKLLNALSEQEREHFEFWLDAAGAPAQQVRVSALRLALSVLLGKVLGVAFTIRRLERGERDTIAKYEAILEHGMLDEARAARLRGIIDEELEHEHEMEERLGDERVAYLGAAVLGLNDALIELTGGLTGLVSTITNPRLIGFSGLIVGFAASMSMAASNFLSEGITEEEDQKIRPGKAALYTGVAYILVVLGLVAPFFFLSNRMTALIVTWTTGFLVVAGFSYYSSVVLGTSFRKRFVQMCALGLGIAAITYAVGRIVSRAFGISL